MITLMSDSRSRDGVFWMVLSGLSFVGVNGIVRYLGADLPAAQSAFLRFLFGAILLLPVVPGLLRNGIPVGVLRLCLGRGVVHTAAVLFWFYAMARIPVADATAIGYLNTVVLLMAGSLLLGEPLSKRRLAAIAVAVLGALIVLRPGARAVSLGHLSQIAAALCFAGSYLFAKRLAGIISASAVVALLSFSVTIGLAPLAAAVWVPISLSQMGWLAVVAVCATSGHFCMTKAFAVAPLTVTQPVTFLQLVWASILGAVVFSEPVDGYVLLGGALIIGAICWVTWREAVDAAAISAQP